VRQQHLEDVAATAIEEESRAPLGHPATLSDHP
jgi:hypothetical protein